MDSRIRRKPHTFVEPVEIQRSVDAAVEAGDYVFSTAIDAPELQYMDFSQEGELLRRGIALDAIESVRVAAFSVHATAPDLDWLTLAELRARAPDLGTRHLASIDGFPPDLATVAWDGEDDADLTALARTGSTSIWVTVTGDSPPHDTVLRVEFTLTVQAQ